MKISVIIPIGRSASLIPDQLEALCRQDWQGSWEILVSNNGPAEGLGPIIEKYRDRLPQLCVVDSSDRRGASHARNVAAQVASGDALLFCDADDVVSDRWVTALATALENNDFVASRLVVESINEPWVVASRPSIMDTQREGLMNFLAFLPWAGAGTIGIKRELFLKVNGFDEQLPALEDVDFCWRVQMTGVQLQFVREAEIHYRLRAELRGMFQQAAFYAQHQVFVLKKFGPLGLPRPRFSWRNFLVRAPHGWASLLRHLPTAFRRRQDAGTWLWNLGWRVGLMKGSLKYRYFVS